MTIVPTTVTPKQLADELGWTERFVRERARALGACIGSGQRMRLTETDVQAIIESERPCQSKSSSAVRSTTIAGRLPATDYEARQRQRTKRQPLGSQRKPKPENG